MADHTKAPDTPPASTDADKFRREGPPPAQQTGETVPQMNEAAADTPKGRSAERAEE